MTSKEFSKIEIEDREFYMIDCVNCGEIFFLPEDAEPKWCPFCGCQFEGFLRDYSYEK